MTRQQKETAVQTVSADDLELAATWLESYEGHPNGEDAETVDAMLRVAARLRQEAEDRSARSVVRALAKQGRKVTMQQARNALAGQRS